jgi:hypothetical protein
MHRLGKAQRSDVVHELLDRIVAADAEIVTKHPRDRRIGEPADIGPPPDVVMRVDRRSAVGRHSFPLLLRCHHFGDGVGQYLEIVGRMVKAGVR